MKTRIQHLFITLIIALYTTNVSAQAVLEIGTASGIPQSNVAVAVNATGVSDMQGFQFTIEYDNSKLTYVNCTDWSGGTNAAGVQINDISADGKLTFVYNDVSVNITSGLFFNLNFQILQTATGVADLTWSDVPTLRELSNSVPEIINGTYNDGSITVVTETAIADNSLTGGQTVCEGETPSVITGSVPTGGTGSFQYEWISSTAGSSVGYSAASGQNDQQDYAPTALGTTTWFKRIVFSGSQVDTSGFVEIELVEVDASVNVSAPLVSANAVGATYQWLDCDNGNAPIGGETGQTFAPTVSGNYAVEVTQNGCTDVSSCTSVTVGGQVPNDECSGAIALDVNATCVSISGDVDSATESLPTCAGGGAADADVWFSFVATGTSATVDVTGSADFDAVLEVFESDCGSLSSLSCVDLTLEAETETADLSGLSAGETYYVRVYDYYSGTPSTTTFDICVYSLTVGMEEVAQSSVLLFPNPTNGQFTIAGVAGDYSVEVYNNMGQLLLRQDAVQANTTLNLQEQAAGVYHVHVIATDYMSRFKLLKQ
jgi:hypothetical protein